MTTPDIYQAAVDLGSSKQWKALVALLDLLPKLQQLEANVNELTKSRDALRNSVAAVNDELNAAVKTRDQELNRIEKYKVLAQNTMATATAEAEEVVKKARKDAAAYAAAERAKADAESKMVFDVIKVTKDELANFIKLRNVAESDLKAMNKEVEAFRKKFGG